MNKIDKPEIKKIMKLFKENHYQIYLVGGCVRDLLLNRPVNDYDMTTSATPTQMETLAKANDIHYIPTGIKHGTITFVLNHEHFEITTFRCEGSYVNNRRPKEISFTNDLKEDVKRRDFTINSICMDENGIVDYFHGIEDLNKELIRCVGDPDTRFKEDALRIMRCIRFALQLDFQIEANTYQALKSNVHLLQNISKERIRDELCKMLLSNHKDILLLLKDSGILDEILPEYAMTYELAQETPYHIYDVFHHMNAVLNSSDNASLKVKLALLLHDLEKKNYKTIDEKGIAHFKQHAHASAILSSKILKRLKFDNRSIKDVYTYIDYHDYYLTPSSKAIRKFLYKLHGDFNLAYTILEVQKYDNMGKNPAITQEKNQIIDEVILMIKGMEKQNLCFQIKDLAINGNDLLKLGYKPQTIGKALTFLLKHILQKQQLNTYDYLINYAGGHKNEIINCQ